MCSSLLVGVVGSNGRRCVPDCPIPGSGTDGGGVGTVGSGSHRRVTAGKLEIEERDPDVELGGPRAQGDLSRLAGRVAIATLVVVGILVTTLVVWEARLVVALLFTAVI